MAEEPTAFDPYGLSGVTSALSASTRHGSSPVREGNIGERARFGRPGSTPDRKGIFQHGATVGQKVGAVASAVLKGGD